MKIPKPDDPTSLFYFEGIPDISLTNVSAAELVELERVVQSGVAKVKWMVCNTTFLEAGRLILLWSWLGTGAYEFLLLASYTTRNH